MKASIYHRFGSPDVLQYEDMADPVPGPGEIVVRVHAVTVNRVLDCAVRAGEQPRRNVTPPHVGGVDPAGLVAAVGEGVTAPAVGTRVAVLSRVPCLNCARCAADEFEACPHSGMLGVASWGGAADYVKVPASIAVPIPDNLDFAEAASVVRHGPMAHYLLFDMAKLQPGETVLAMGAAGGLGSTGIQIAKAAGCRVACTAGSDDRVAVGMALGADFGVNYNTHDLTDAVMGWTGGDGVEVVFENISNPATWPKALACLKRHGRLVTAGAHGGGKVELDCAMLYHRNLSVLGGTGGTGKNVADTIALAADGRLGARVEKILPLSQAAQAHRIIEAGIPLGKIVLDPTLG